MFFYFIFFFLIFKFFNFRKLYFRAYIDFSKLQAYLDRKFRTFFYFSALNVYTGFFYCGRTSFFFFPHIPFFYDFGRFYFFFFTNDNLIINNSNNYYLFHFTLFIGFFQTKLKIFNFFNTYIIFI